MTWESGQPTRTDPMERHVVISQRELRDHARTAIAIAILAAIAGGITGFILGLFAHALWS